MEVFWCAGEYEIEWFESVAKKVHTWPNSPTFKLAVGRYVGRRTISMTSVEHVDDFLPSTEGASQLCTSLLSAVSMTSRTFLFTVHHAVWLCAHAQVLLTPKSTLEQPRLQQVEGSHDCSAHYIRRLAA